MEKTCWRRSNVFRAFISNICIPVYGTSRWKLLPNSMVPVHTLSFIRTLTLDNFNSIFASSLISTFSLTFVRVFAYENFLHTQYFFMSTSEKVFLSFLSPFIRQYLFSVFFFLTQTFQTSSSFPFLFLFFSFFFFVIRSSQRFSVVYFLFSSRLFSY